MLILAFDTATPAVTVALHDGASALATSTVVDARRHGELLAPGIERVLAEAGARSGDITDIAVGVGPGPFTGLRVGLATARALGHALGLPVHGACTLDVLAFECGLAEPFLVATDARRKEVYWARYADAGRRVAGPAVSRPADVAGGPAGDGSPAVGLPVAGQGALLYPEAFPRPVPPAYPSAAALAALVAARLAEGAETLPPAPLYLRRPDAAVPGPRKQVTPV